MAEGADLLCTGLPYQEAAANVAEYYDIPLATLHYVPARPNGRLVPSLPALLGRAAMSVFDWLGWRVDKRVGDAQRLQLGLPKAKGPAPLRIAARGSLEIQAYDQYRLLKVTCLLFWGRATRWLGEATK